MVNAIKNAKKKSNEITTIKYHLNEGLNFKEIALIMKVNPTTISRKCKKLGLKKKKKVVIVETDQMQNNANTSFNGVNLTDDHTLPVEVLVDEDDIDESFQKMIKYKAFAKQMGEDIKYNVIQRHLIETNQMQKNKEEFVTDDEFVTNLQTFFQNLRFFDLDYIEDRRIQLISNGEITEP